MVEIIICVSIAVALFVAAGLYLIWVVADIEDVDESEGNE